MRATDHSRVRVSLARVARITIAAPSHRTHAREQRRAKCTCSRASTAITGMLSHSGFMLREVDETQRGLDSGEAGVHTVYSTVF